MELQAIKRVYFVGIGGIGMSAIARYFAKRGCLVHGYDKTRTVLCESLEAEGIQITYLDDEGSLTAEFFAPDDATLVVYTPAIPKDSKLLDHFTNNGFALHKRSQVLGIISAGMFCIAVAGTHGKTTTSAMIAHILKDTGYDCTAFLGGIASNYESNFLLGNNNVVVVEADEYDRSFLTLHPDIAVITSMDADHLDIYGDAAQLVDSFKLFAGQLKNEGTLFIKQGLPIAEGTTTYGIDNGEAVSASGVAVAAGHFVFDYKDETQSIKGIRMMLPGRHNIENATAAIAVALQLGIDAALVKKAVESFKGVKRRFEFVVRNEERVYIDDYAHHPAELSACFAAVRELFPGRKLAVIFQPHLFTRTRDFADEFAAVLSTVDELILLDIYPARELPIAGINAEFLFDKISIMDKRILNKAQVLGYMEAKKPSLLLTVGAGDIDTLVGPLKTIYDA
jgi:UDP-N-acetylmuramate--alanine ligase